MQNVAHDTHGSKHLLAFNGHADGPMVYDDDSYWNDEDAVYEPAHSAPMDASDDGTDGESEDVPASAVTSPANPYQVYQAKPLLDLLDRTRHSKWPERTDACCWWCCHRFDTVPCALPLKYREGKGFTVKGCFCSFSCVKAYHLNDAGRVGEGVRTGLLFQMCLRLWKLNPNRDRRAFRGVVAAPSRTCLKMFGGYMSIDEFRASTRTEIHMVKEPPYDMEFIQQVDCARKISERARIAKKNAAPPRKRIEGSADAPRKAKAPAPLSVKRTKSLVNPSCSLDKFVTFQSK